MKKEQWELGAFPASLGPQRPLFSEEGRVGGTCPEVKQGLRLSFLKSRLQRPRQKSRDMT